jgi:hypothetical protein
MKRILLRSTKSPFEAVSPAAVERDWRLIGANTGNLLFIEAAWKLLETRDVAVESDRFKLHELDADAINERYDAYVIPLANGFRVSFMRFMQEMTPVVRKLKIPVILLGGGLQAKLPYAPGVKRPQDEVVKEFIGAVMDRSGRVGVRGEWTQDYLQRLGFKDVDVIGCPSMFLHGDRLEVRKRTPTLDRDSRITINVTARISEMGPIVESHAAKYPNLTYIGQEMDCLRMLMWGEGMRGMPDPNPLPVHPSHPLVRDGRTKFWVDPWPWIDYLRNADFSFGTRIHGNIAALLAGTPAYVLGHDTRTTELARYFEIPHRTISETSPETDAAALYEEADYGPLMANHRRRFETFIGYVEGHGLKHVFQPGEDPEAFDRRVASTRYPGSVELYSGPTLERYQRRAKRVAGKTIRRARRVLHA